MATGPGAREQDIAHYTCHRTRDPGSLKGAADGAAWQQAPRSPRFVDMVSGEPGYFDTRAAARHSDDGDGRCHRGAPARKAARARFMPPLAEEQLPLGLCECFGIESVDRMVELLRFLAPITTVSKGKSPGI